ncbi:MAG: hypothetical protein V3W09_03175 [Nitrososphaerales archaeon]
MHSKTFQMPPIWTKGLLILLLPMILQPLLMPAYRPDWFDMQTMIRLIELNLVFTAAGVIIMFYGALRSYSRP